MLDVSESQARDWRWRLNHLYKIIDKDGNQSTFKENWMQREINDCRARRKLGLKYRQGGFTTNEILKQLDFVCFSPNKTACIMADEQGNMENIFKKVRYAYRHMPYPFKPRLKSGTTGSKYELYFPDLESTIYCDLEGRGTTIHWLHISEAAFAKPERIKSTLETVPINGIVTFETTPNGLGNHFYKRWVRKNSLYRKLFFPWFKHPEYRIQGAVIKEYTKEEKEFIKRTKKELGVKIDQEQIAFRRFKQQDQETLYIQEYPENDITCFLASGDAAMDLELVAKLLAKVDEPIRDDGTLKIWEEFSVKNHYVIGADAAEGKNKDYSVGTVLRLDTLEEVAQIRSNKWSPYDFADKLVELAEMYHSKGRHWPQMAVERNNHGHAVLMKLQNFCWGKEGCYPNLYYYKDDVEDKEKYCGWQTDKITRPVMIDAFIDGVRNGTLTLNSRETLEECLTLVNNDGKIEASEGEHDDTVIAGSIALQVAIKEIPKQSAFDDLETKIRM